MLTLLADLPDDLRRRALTHPAFAPSRGDSFERLEYLGDAVLDLVVSEELFRTHPDMGEGDMSKVRAAVVSRDSCELVALEHGLGAAMVEEAGAHGSAARATAERLAEQRNARAALVESVIGASFVASGYAATAPRVVAVFEGRMVHALANRSDAKSSLQELASRIGAQVTYEAVSEAGPPHDRRFTVAAVLAGGSRTLRTEGAGRSKQEAQQRAAATLLDQMDET